MIQAEARLNARSFCEQIEILHRALHLSFQNNVSFFDQHCDVILLQNFMHTPYTLNAITFQLTTVSSLSKSLLCAVSLDAKMIKDLSTAVIVASNGEVPSYFSKLTYIIKHKFRHLLVTSEPSLADTTPSIILSDGLASLRPVCVYPCRDSYASVDDDGRNGSHALDRGGYQEEGYRRP